MECTVNRWRNDRESGTRINFAVARTDLKTNPAFSSFVLQPLEYIMVQQEARGKGLGGSTFWQEISESNIILLTSLATTSGSAKHI